MGAMETVMFPMYLWAISTLFLVGDAGSCRDHSLSENPVALFLFGDSLFDAGNNNYIRTSHDFQANYWPYGETFFDTPTGRATDGRTISDFISEYANLPFIPPYLQPDIDSYDYGVNFASIGAGSLLETYPGFVIDLKTQLSNFKKVEKQLRHKLGGEQVPVLLSAAVYLFSIGGNDYFAAFEKNPGFLVSQEEFVARVIGNIADAIQEVYNIGGRKFGFLNLSPIGCLPSMKALKLARTDGCVEELNELAKLHNRALSEALQKLESKLIGFKYSKHDFYTSLNKITENPSKYGFKEVAMACCGSGPYRGFSSCGSPMKEYELCDNPSDFLYFDHTHPTEKANERFAKLFWNGNSDITGPYNLESLFELDNKCRLNLDSS